VLIEENWRRKINASSPHPSPPSAMEERETVGRFLIGSGAIELYQHFS
jgi:hypothetical protein